MRHCGLGPVMPVWLAQCARLSRCRKCPSMSLVARRTLCRLLAASAWYSHADPSHLKLQRRILTGVSEGSTPRWRGEICALAKVFGMLVFDLWFVPDALFSKRIHQSDPGVRRNAQIVVTAWRVRKYLTSTTIDFFLAEDTFEN